MMDFVGAASPALAQAGYLYPNKAPMAVEPLFRLRSDSTARPFDISFLSRPHSMPPMPIHHLGQTSTSLGPRLPPSPRPTNLTLKTFPTLSLPMQTTTFNAMNEVDLDVCTSPPPPPPIHLSSTVMRSSANSTKKNGPYPFHH